jgi:hypothetical protein
MPGSGEVIELPTEISDRVAAGCLRAFLAAKSNVELENVIRDRLRPNARALLEKLTQIKVPRVHPKGVRELGRTSDGTAFVKDEGGVLQRIDGHADVVLQRIVKRAPGVCAYYAANVPHLIQIMRINTSLVRGAKQNAPVEATAGSPERVHKKQRNE